MEGRKKSSRRVRGARRVAAGESAYFSSLGELRRAHELIFRPGASLSYIGKRRWCLLAVFAFVVVSCL